MFTSSKWKLGWFVLTLSLLSLGVAIDQPTNLKAYDGSYRKLPINSETWENFSDTVLIEWKEPWGDVKGYQYYFGQDKNGIPLTDTAETKYVSAPLSSEGIYYFRVRSVGEDKSLSPIKTIAIYHDVLAPLVDNLKVLAYADEKKEQALADNVGQHLSNRPFLVFNTAGLNIAGAPLKGINIYWGSEKNGTPNRQINANSLKIEKAVPKDVTYYLRANVEDEAGNISQTKTLLTFIFNGEVPIPADKPEMKILSRSIDIDNGSSTNNAGAFPGSIITYKIILNNAGKASAQDVEISDIIPANTTYLVGTGQSTKPATVELWDTTLNGGKGAWCANLTPNKSNVTKIRWLFTEPFEPARDNEKKQATVTYGVKVNR